MHAMSIQSPPMSALVLLFAASTAVCGFVRAADAADLPVLRLHRAVISDTEKHAGSVIGGPEAADSIATRGIPIGNAPVVAATGHVLAARARFIEARAMMERAI